MTIYTISQVLGTWRVSRYDGSNKSISILHDQITSEGEARARALLRAEGDRPSKVMQIKSSGFEDDIAEFNPY